MSTVLGVVSGKGGTGKSTVSCGLAIAFSKLKKSVLLVDLDEGLRCIDLIMGVDSKVVYDLGDILSGADFEEAIYPAAGYPVIHIVPAPITPGTLSPDALINFLNQATKRYDVLIFDFPAGVDFSLCSALGKYAQFITVCNMDPVSVRDASVAAKRLPCVKHEPRLILNRFNAEYIKDGVYKNIDGIIDDSGIRLLGLVPSTMELAMLSVNHGLSKKGNSLKSFLRIARRLLGENVELPKIKKI